MCIFVIFVIVVSICVSISYVYDEARQPGASLDAEEKVLPVSQELRWMQRRRTRPATTVGGCGARIPDLCLLLWMSLATSARLAGGLSWTRWQHMQQRRGGTTTGVDGSRPRFGILCCRHGSDALHLPCVQVLTDLLSGV